MRRIDGIALLLACGLAGAAAATVTLELDADAYTFGDVIEITITNTGTQAVEFASDPPWCVYNLDDPHGCGGLPVMWSFGAGEVLSVAYDTDWWELPPGDCAVTVHWYEDDEPFVATQFFDVAPLVGNERSRWGAVKSLYR